MRKPKNHVLWVIGTMILAYSMMQPSASGQSSDLDTKRAGEQQEVQQQEEGKQHKHSHSHSHKKLSSEEIKQMRLKKLQRLAEFFNISTEGKTLDQLRSEIEQAKKEQPEKWEEFKQQFRAKKLEKIREYAKSKGLDVEGKTAEQLHDELQQLEQSTHHHFH